ncbi:MAG: hypothetical protein SGJ10_06115 [Bacteroidota bacterium]|nr:hypothetical protein [Bacteroidota bacterium]
MQKLILCSFCIVILLGIVPIQSRAQALNNDFRIGVFGTSLGWYYSDSLGYVPYHEPYMNDSYYSSVLNVLAADGFNTYVRYEACSSGMRENYLKQELLLAKKVGMKMHVGLGYYFKPTLIKDTFYGSGDNIYDACGVKILPQESAEEKGLYRIDYSHYFNSIFSKAPYKDAIWGYHLAEEAEYCHLQHRGSDCKGFAGWGEFEASSTSCNGYNSKFPYYCKCETPPENIESAKNYFKDILNSNGVYNHHFITMPANHGKSINKNSYDDNNSIYDSVTQKWSGFNSPDYIKIMTQKQDVVFEGSYTTVGSRTKHTKEKYKNIYSNKYHYLGQYKSIDFIKKYCSNIQKVVAVGNTWYADGGGYLNNYHLDTNIKNANWLWFQAYTSIIHGANGIWFWWLHDMWQMDENPNVWDNTKDTDRYARENFPKLYKNYVSYLTREVRYLVNLNLISTEPNTILMGKTDHTDTNHIIPPSKEYIKHIKKEYRNENYGLRYTIRTNGENIIMIISNPCYKAVSTTLDFSKIKNDMIQKSDSVTVLFEDGTKISKPSYKVDRNSHQSAHYNIALKKHKLKIEMGPLDVKILLFGPKLVSQ